MNVNVHTKQSVKAHIDEVLGKFLLSNLFFDVSDIRQ